MTLQFDSYSKLVWFNVLPIKNDPGVIAASIIISVFDEKSFVLMLLKTGSFLFNASIKKPLVIEIVNSSLFLIVKSSKGGNSFSLSLVISLTV